jgi:hypothetical protein
MLLGATKKALDMKRKRKKSWHEIMLGQCKTTNPTPYLDKHSARTTTFFLSSSSLFSFTIPTSTSLSHTHPTKKK